MRRSLKITVLIVVVLLMFILLSISLVRRTSYFNEEYFKTTAARIDTIRSAAIINTTSVEAGFAKISITPELTDSENYYPEGKFVCFPLAGYGDRKGKPATGVHDALKISECIVLAINDLKPARIGSGDFNAEKYTRKRVLGESGTKNNDFSFIVLEQAGYKKAIIGSFSAHATTLGEENMLISGDYPGYWQRRIESTSADIALFCAGAIGSQSPVGTGDQFEKAKYIGESLADSVNVHMDAVVLNDKPVISFVSAKIGLPDYHIRLTRKINLSTFWSKRLMSQPENVFIQAIRIDDMVWITTPGDFSGEYALQIKNTLLAEGFKSNITSFNGSYAGYIVPGRYFYMGGYEPGLMGWFGPDMGEYTMDVMRQLAEIVTGRENL